MRTVRQTIENPTSGGTENSGRRPGLKCPCQVLAALVETAQRAPDIALELGFRYARFLEIEDVMELTLSHRLHQLSWFHRRAWQKGRVDTDDSFDSFRGHQCCVPSHHSAPIVADDHALGQTKGIQ